MSGKQRRGKKTGATSVKWKVGQKIRPTIASVRSIPKWTVLEIAWSDITEDSVGDPKKAHMVHRRSLGRFYCFKRDDGVPVMVLALQRDADSDHQSGWFCIPLAVIRELEVIKLEEEVESESDS